MTMLEDRPTMTPTDDVCSACGHRWSYHGEVEGEWACWHPTGPRSADCGCDALPPARGSTGPSFPSGGPIARLPIDDTATRAATAMWAWPDGEL